MKRFTVDFVEALLGMLVGGWDTVGREDGMNVGATLGDDGASLFTQTRIGRQVKYCLGKGVNSKY